MKVIVALISIMIGSNALAYNNIKEFNNDLIQGMGIVTGPSYEEILAIQKKIDSNKKVVYIKIKKESKAKKPNQEFDIYSILKLLGILLIFSL